MGECFRRFIFCTQSPHRCLADADSKLVLYHIRVSVSAVCELWTGKDSGGDRAKRSVLLSGTGEILTFTGERAIEMLPPFPVPRPFPIWIARLSD